MLQMLVGAAIGAAAGYLYGSEQGRQEARRRLAKAPEPVRRATQAAAAALGTGAERAVGTLANAPMPQPVRQAAQRAGAAVQAGAQQAGAMAAGAPTIVLPTETEIASRPDAPLPALHPEST